MYKMRPAIATTITNIVVHIVTILIAPEMILHRILATSQNFLNQLISA
jgi:hypothetical protein